MNVLVYIMSVLICLYYIDSYWAEAAGGEFISRLSNNRKHVEYSMMADYRERAFVTMVRTLYPEVLQGAQKSKRYDNIFSDHPAYLSSTPRCELKKKLKSRELKINEHEMLERFLRDNNYEIGGDEFLSECTFHAKAVINNITVSTVAMENGNVTCDSVICGRYDDDDCEEYFFGQVQHIVALEDETFLCVDWFHVPDLEQEQLMGLSIIPAKMTVDSQRQQKWIPVASILLQQHILVKESTDSGDLIHIAIKP